MARRAKADLETELKRIEEEARAKTRQAEEIREKIKQTRVDDFIKWCKRHDMDAMQFFKLAILDDWGAEIKAIYSKMTAEPVGVIKPVAEAVKFKEKKAFPAPATVEHSEAEKDDNQAEENIDSDDETEDIDDDDNLSDSDDSIDEDIDYSDEESDSDDDIDSDSGQQKLWN